MIKPSKIYKMRIVFHLAADAPGRADVVGMLRTWILKSGLPFARAKQNPKAPRIAYGPGIKRGQFATREYAELYLFTSVSAQKARTRLESCKPQGLTLLDAKRVPFALAGVQQLASVVAYEVQGDFASYHPTQTLENYVASPRLEVTRTAPGGLRMTTDLKPFVRSARLADATHVQLMLNRVDERWISPLELISAWLGEDFSTSEDTADARFTIIRQGLYWQDSQDSLHLI